MNVAHMDCLDVAVLTDAPITFGIFADFVGLLGDGMGWGEARLRIRRAWDGGCDPADLAEAIPPAPANDNAWGRRCQN